MEAQKDILSSAPMVPTGATRAVWCQETQCDAEDSLDGDLWAGDTQLAVWPRPRGMVNWGMGTPPGGAAWMSTSWLGRWL